MRIMGRKHDKPAEDRQSPGEAAPPQGAAPSADAQDASPQPAADDRTATLERERDDLKDKLLRAQAECANISKRLHQQHEQSLKLAGMGLARSCLNVLDSLERSLQAVPTESSGDPIVQGVTMIRDEFIKALGEHGVEPMESVGHPFDPTRHEALMRDPASNLPPNTITTEYQRGYLMHGRVLRPAKVVVSSEPEPAPPDQPGNEGSHQAGDDAAPTPENG